MSEYERSRFQLYKATCTEKKLNYKLENLISLITLISLIRNTIFYISNKHKNTFLLFSVVIILEVIFIFSQAFVCMLSETRRFQYSYV